MVNTGTTTVTATIANGSATHTFTYTGLSSSITGTPPTGATLGTTTPADGGPVGPAGTSSGSTTLTAGSGTGAVTITTTVASVTNTNGSDAPFTSGGTSTLTVDIVDNRVVDASTVNFGRVIVGTDASTTSTLTTTGSDADYTRVTVGNAGPDANGISVTGGTNPVFNGPSVTDVRTVSGTFTTAGQVTRLPSP